MKSDDVRNNGERKYDTLQMKISTVQTSVFRPEGITPLGKPRHRWEDYITMYLREIGWKRVDWMHLAHDRDNLWALVNTVTNLRVP
jgi:hypothetical protein